jgi:hypothetical protein
MAGDNGYRASGLTGASGQHSRAHPISNIRHCRIACFAALEGIETAPQFETVSITLISGSAVPPPTPGYENPALS